MSMTEDNLTAPRARRRRLGGALTKAERAAAQDTFIATFARTCNVAASCRQAGISRETFYKWQEHDEQFGMRYHLAELDAVDVLRAAAHRRGVEGWDEPVFSQGKLVTRKDGTPFTVRKYSDACLLALLKARAPEFRDKVDVSVQGGVTHEHQHRIIEDDPEAAGIARALVRRITSGGPA